VTRRAWLAWAALWLAPLAISVCALLAEAGLEANNYNGWIAPWIQINIVCELLTLLILVAALVGGRWARGGVAALGSADAGRGILPERAPSAVIEG
jgi:hypothetical protein